MAKINNKNITKPTRVDQEFEREMRELAKIRYLKNLDKKLPSSADMTKLLRRTDAWNQCVFELKTKPRRENI